MRIVVLTKPVPDPASGGERLGPDGRLDRANSPAVVNGNDEYVLEKALKLVEAAGEGEVVLLTMAPANAPETMRKALAMGATSGVLVTDPAIEGCDTVATTRILAAALKTLEFDLVFAGVDTSDGRPVVVAPGVAALTGLPYLSYAATIEPDTNARTVRVRRITADRLRRPRGAAAGADLRHPGARRAALPVAQGDHGGAHEGDRDARLGDLGIDPATVGLAGCRRRRSSVRSHPSRRAATRVVREAPDEAARQVVALLAERRII